MVVHRRRQLEPAALGSRAVAVDHSRVAAGTGGHDAAGELEIEEDRLLDLAELHRIGEAGLRADGDRLLACDAARGLQGVDSQVDQRPAARQRLAQAPLARVADGKADRGLDDLEPAEDLLARQSHHLQVVRLEVQAIADGELSPGRAGRRDHLVALLDRNGHRFFAEHVLTGLSGADRVLGMHAVGQHDVDDVDVGVVFDAVEGVIAVDVLLRNAVLLGPLTCLLRAAADEPGEAAVLCLLKSWRELPP